MDTHVPVPHPVVPDHLVRAAVAAARVLLHDGPFAVDATFVKWTRSLGTRQLTALVRNPVTMRLFVAGYDNRQGRVRILGPAR